MVSKSLKIYSVVAVLIIAMIAVFVLADQLIVVTPNAVVSFQVNQTSSQSNQTSLLDPSGNFGINITGNYTNLTVLLNNTGFTGDSAITNITISWFLRSDGLLKANFSMSNSTSTCGRISGCENLLNFNFTLNNTNLPDGT